MTTDERRTYAPQPQEQHQEVPEDRTGQPVAEGEKAPPQDQGTPPDPAAERARIVKELRDERAEDERSPWEALKERSKGTSQDERDDDGGQPEGRGQPPQAKEGGAQGRPKAAIQEQEKKDEQRPEPKEERRLAEQRHQRELRAATRQVEEARTQLTELKRQNQELQSTVEGLAKDPLKFLVDRKVNLAQLAEQMVSAKGVPDELTKEPDPRDAKLAALEQQLKELLDGRKQAEEEAKEQQKRQQQHDDWNAASRFITAHAKDYPFINALGADAVREMIDTFYSWDQEHPEEVQQHMKAGTVLSHLAKHVEEHIADRERKRYSRLSSLVGAPASGAPADDGQKKPAANDGQKKMSQGSTALSADGTTPFRGTRKSAAPQGDEDLDEKFSRLWDQRMAAKARA